MPFAANRTQNLKVDIIKIVNDIFNEAISQGASDIHLEPRQDGLVIRYRVDGKLKIISEGDKRLMEFIISRIKILLK